MEEHFFRKVRYTLSTIAIVLCTLGILWGAIELHRRDLEQIWLLAIVDFGALIVMWTCWLYLRMYVKCIICRQPALVLTDDRLQIFRFYYGDYLTLTWDRIESFEPYVFKGHTLYYVVLKDYDEFYRQEPSRYRRFLLRMDSGLTVSGAVTCIDINTMDADPQWLLNRLNSHLSPHAVPRTTHHSVPAPA